MSATQNNLNNGTASQTVHTVRNYQDVRASGTTQNSGPSTPDNQMNLLPLAAHFDVLPQVQPTFMDNRAIEIDAEQFLVAQYLMQNLTRFLATIQNIQKGRFSKPAEQILQTLYAGFSPTVGTTWKYSIQKMATVLGIHRKTAGHRFKQGSERRRKIESGDSEALIITVEAKIYKKFSEETKDLVAEFVRENVHIRVSPIKTDVLQLKVDGKKHQPQSYFEKLPSVSYI